MRNLNLNIFNQLLKEVKEFNQHLTHYQATALTSLILKEEKSQKPKYTKEQYEADFKANFNSRMFEENAGLSPDDINIALSSNGNNYIKIVKQFNPYFEEQTDKYGRTDYNSSNKRVEFYIWEADEELLQQLKEVAKNSIKVRIIGKLWNCSAMDDYIKISINAETLKQNQDFYFGTAF
jgi:TfoX/Sxy family transcriptional regulator of competence genes